MRARIPGSWFALVMTVSALAGCERVSGGGVSTFIPTAPSVPTAQPLVWDSREELSAWVNNAITKGTVSVEGEGSDAFIRVVIGPQGVLLRGPDLEPPVAGITAVHVRYRWAYEGQSAPGAYGRGHLSLFAFLQPAQMTAPSQPMASMDTAPTGGAWQEATMRFRESSAAPLSVPMRYVRLSDGAGDVYGNYSPPPGVLDIDWIRLER